MLRARDGRRAWAARLAAGVALAMLLAAGGPAEPGLPDATARGRAQQPTFASLDVFADVGAQDLAGWQAELVLAAGLVVGIEGGDPAAFRDAPRYDPAALHGGRVILAALAQGQEFPSGRVRVARVHVMEQGGDGARWDVRNAVATNVRGERIRVDVQIRRRGDR
ncbi:MAG: hypothetical protein IPM29_26640 [Planctomycetes bacterium]|nr:hypothetical protein [Planctomycetota bacterium]